jgi:hypothetical protein
MVRGLWNLQAAFGAAEAYRLDVPDGGVVARLSADGAEFLAEWRGFG